MDVILGGQLEDDCVSALNGCLTPIIFQSTFSTHHDNSCYPHLVDRPIKLRISISCISSSFARSARDLSNFNGFQDGGQVSNQMCG